MFQLLRDPQIDFMRRGKVYLAVSSILIVASIVTLAVRGLNLGIEFTGGTEIQLKYASAPKLGEIRDAVGRIVKSTPQVTTLGDVSQHEVVIRIQIRGDESSGDATQAVVDALRSPEDRERAQSGLINLNRWEEARLSAAFEQSGVIGRDQAAELAASIAEKRREQAILTSFDDLSAIPGMTPEAMSWLKSRAFFGGFTVRGQSYIGPAIGKELMHKAFWAILGSIAGVLVYIALRFQFQWGLAAVIALVHDTIITLGLFSLFREEMSLPVVASFLTLIGYSVNDTVVVFDRIRENVKLRGSQDLADTVNRSINQTLSRTVITSGLTWLVVLALYLFGGEALRPFSFVLTVGIVVGTYSSVCIASPILVLWKQAMMRRKGLAAASPDRRRTARKVRTRSAG